MARQSDKAFAQELVARGLLTQPAVEQYLAEIHGTAESLQAYLIRMEHLSEAEVLDVLAAAFHLKKADFRNLTIPKDVLDKIPVRVAAYFKFMPIKIEDKILTVASSSPLDLKLKDEIRVHLGYEPVFLLAREKDILEAINKYYGLAADTIDQLEKDQAASIPSETGTSSWVEDVEQSADDASVGKLVNEIIFEAYKKRATDIHIEPYRNKVRIRYRIDGVLIDANVPTAVRQFLPSIISRIKLMANLNIVDKRIPQDGSAIVKTKEQNLDLRVSTIPTPHGESMVIRILPSDVMLFSLERLGLSMKNLDIFRGLVNRPNGIVLVTGPTGSGKTTTLYACLNEINDPNIKIITLEDPIEYEVEGITQIQVNPAVQMNFAAGLRSILRHDPDVIMVGEIRDIETAEIAIRTALTGHVVFSTLHTNDAASGVTRLLEMGLEPFLVSSSIQAFIAQRLVRIICPKCKKESQEKMTEIKQEIAAALKLASAEGIKIYKGAGCDYCNQTGFFGRTALYEVLPISEKIRAAILDRKRVDDIKRIAVEQGMLTLRQDGWQKVLDGVTTPEEVMNVTARDDESVLVDVPGGRDGDGVSSPQMVEKIVDPQILSAENLYNARTYPRIAAKVGIRYAIVKQDRDNPNKLITDNIEHSSITKDISAGGLRFVSGYTLPVGTILEMKIQLDKAERSVNCLARVCRVEDDALSAMFNLAVYYLDLSGSDRTRLTTFVKNILDKQAKTEK